MIRTSLLVTACAAAVALSAATARADLADIAPAGFERGATFSVAGYDAARPALTNFPVLVRIAENSPSGFSYTQMQLQDGDDLCFVDMDANGLPFEIDTWDPQGTSLVWVSLPTMTNGAPFAMCWGGTTPGKNVCAGNPFAGYYGVWHMNEADARDSSTNRLDGTADASVTAVDAMLGKGAKFPSDSGGSTGIRTADTPNSDFASAISFETWACPFVVNGEVDHAFFGKEALATFKIRNGATLFTTPGKTDFKEVNQSIGANTWHHLVLTFVPRQSAKVYVDGELKKTQADTKGFNTLNQSYPVVIGSNQWSEYYNGVLDECRLLTTELSADWIAASYATQAAPAFLTAGEGRPIDAGAPTVTVPAIVRNADGSFAVSVVISENDAKDGSVKCFAAGTEFPMATTNEALPKTYAATLACPPLPASTTLVYSVQAESARGDTIRRIGAETFHTGDVSVEKIADADEDGLVPGVFRISRSDTGPALPVSFALSGTAVEGLSYRAMERTATIPAGTNAVDVVVHPLIDPLDQSRTVELALSPGLYGVAASAGSAALSIANLELPADRNTWIAADAGLASEGSNWSFNHAPLASEHVLFDGRFSNADCEWDAAATHAVGAWTQDNGYTGTVTVCTVFPGKGDFTNLVVTGAMTIDAGSLTHPQSRQMDHYHADTWDWLGDLKANETYRLRVSAGSLHVGAGGLIDARGKGYYVTHNGSRVKGCAHGGRLSAVSPPCYGDPREPVHIGMPLHTSNNKTNGKGGGAVYLTVVGDAVVDGTIRVDAWDASSNFEKNGDYAGAMGAAGSVYLRADRLSGRGRITAMGTGPWEEGISFPDAPVNVQVEKNYKGTGGRVAIVTREPVDRSTFAAISAEGYWSGTPESSWVAHYGGGSGTVVFIDEIRTNGLLVVAQQATAVAPSLDPKYPTIWRCPSVTDEGDWTFDAIEFGHRGFLRVPEGTRLALPGGLASCYGTEADADAIGGLRYEGGTLDIGGGDQTIAGNWMFVPWTNFVFQANVTVTNGAAIGFHPLTDVFDGGVLPAIVPSCSFEVPGDLLVGADAAIRATDCGFAATNDTASATATGVHSHGGRAFYKGRDASGATESRAFDSVFAPRLPGCTAGPGLVIGNNKYQRSGGAVRIVVGGSFALDGLADVGGRPDRCKKDDGRPGGAGGSLDVTAGRLVGNGSFRASGGNYNDYGGPGGRIAIRLTAPDADFASFTNRIHAGGGSWWRGGTNAVHDTSAGTVYLETAADGDRRGTIRIAMDPVNIGYILGELDKAAAHDNTNTTEMVSLGYGGDDPRDYRRVRYVVSDYGRAAVNTNFAARSVTIADTVSFLDLEGNEITVEEFLYPVSGGAGGLRMRSLASGVHSLASLEARGVANVYDSSPDATGRIVVRGRATLLILR